MQGSIIRSDGVISSYLKSAMLVAKRAMFGAAL